jgi:hypothetical protein
LHFSVKFKKLRKMAGLFLGLASATVLPALALGGAVQYQLRPHPMDTVEARKAGFRLLPGVVLPEGSTLDRKEFVTSKGKHLSFVEYTPKKIKAVIFYCHGYCDSTVALFHARAAKLVQEVRSAKVWLHKIVQISTDDSLIFLLCYRVTRSLL